MMLRLMNRAMIYQMVFVYLLVLAYVSAIAVAPEGGEVEKGDTCTDLECQELVKTIKEQMGSEIPCEDFHKYVCGNWQGDLERNVTSLKKKAVITLADLLGNASAPPIENLNATDKLIQAYHSCTINGRKNKTIKMSIERVIKQYKFNRWPIIRQNGKNPSLNATNAYKNVLKKTGPRPVFSYSIFGKGSDSVILMTKPWEFYVFDTEKSSLPISRSDLESELDGESETPSTNYYDYDDQLAKQEVAYKAFIRKTIRLLKKSVSEEDAMKVVEDIVRIEKQFAKFANEAKAEEQRLNISQLDAFVGDGFSMVPILKRDFDSLNIDIKEETEVVVRYIDYYKKAVNFMKCITSAQLANYILWAKIRKMAEATGTPLNDIYLEFQRNTSFPDFTFDGESFEAGSAVETATLKLQCTRQLLQTGVMYTAGAHYYIMAKFNESAKKDVLKMMEFVNDSFMHAVKDNTWMSQHTREEATKRLQKMGAVIGYPDWMLNETIINTAYRFVPDIMNNASFAEHFHFLLENEHKQTLLKLKPGTYFDKVDETVTLRSHAYYVDASNSLVYPAAALVTHYRGHPIPRSVNFGAIGSVLAQLFATSIERFSHLPSEKGKYYKDNWDNETRNQFCKRSSCLNNTEECNDTSVPESHKHEKLRDYLGIRISFEAMHKSKQNYTPPFLLSDEEAFDSENKTFFILFGNLYCPYSVKEKRVQARSDDEQKYHDSLNEIVYTYNEFNKTFKCDVTPGADTCNLMPTEESTPFPNC